MFVGIIIVLIGRFFGFGVSVSYQKFLEYKEEEAEIQRKILREINARQWARRKRDQRIAREKGRRAKEIKKRLERAKQDLKEARKTLDNDSNPAANILFIKRALKIYTGVMGDFIRWSDSEGLSSEGCRNVNAVLYSLGDVFHEDSKCPRTSELLGKIATIVFHLDHEHDIEKTFGRGVGTSTSDLEDLVKQYPDLTAVHNEVDKRCPNMSWDWYCDAVASKHECINPFNYAKLYHDSQGYYALLEALDKRSLSELAEDVTISSAPLPTEAQSYILVPKALFLICVPLAFILVMLVRKYVWTPSVRPVRKGWSLVSGSGPMESISEKKSLVDVMEIEKVD